MKYLSVAQTANDGEFPHDVFRLCVTRSKYQALCGSVALEQFLTMNQNRWMPESKADGISRMPMHKKSELHFSLAFQLKKVYDKKFS